MADILGTADIEGIIASDTTTSGIGVETYREAAETGRLSATSLLEPSAHILRFMSAELKGAIPLIGCGGIMDGGAPSLQCTRADLYGNGLRR